LTSPHLPRFLNMAGTCEFTFLTDPTDTILRWHAQEQACRGRPGGAVLPSE